MCTETSTIWLKVGAMDTDGIAAGAVGLAWKGKAVNRIPSGDAVNEVVTVGL